MAPIHDIITELALELIGADCCEFLVEEGDRLVVKSRSLDRQSALNDSYSLWSSIPGNAYRSGMTCLIDDAQDTRSSGSGSSASEADADSYRSLSCVPIDPDAMLLAKAKTPGAFTEQDQELLDHLADLSVLALWRIAQETLRFDGGPSNGRDYAAKLEEIADILSHDLMNPLSVVEGNIELAQETGNLDHLDQAASGLKRVIELIEEVVFLARTRELIEATEAVELRNPAESAWENMQTEDATLEIVDSITFQGSQRAVSHLMENLFDNALTHAGTGVKVRIGSLEDGLYIEDDGPGIPESHHEKIFERGFSVEAGSSGLGLHIVNRIADAHGWDVDASDSSLGGARLEVTCTAESSS